MRPISFSRALTAGATGAVCAAQTTAGAGNLLINGSLAAGGVASFAVQRQVGISSTGNLSGVTFTLFGTDDQGRVISEAITGPNNGTVTSVLNYLTVTRVAVSGAVGTNVTVDTNGVGASTEVPLDLYVTDFDVNLVVEVTGTVNYTVQYTFDNVQTTPGGPFNWINHSQLTSLSANANGTLIGPTAATRVLTNSGTGTVKFTVLQAGLT